MSDGPYARRGGLEPSSSARRGGKATASRRRRSRSTLAFWRVVGLYLADGRTSFDEVPSAGRFSRGQRAAPRRRGRRVLAASRRPRALVRARPRRMSSACSRADRLCPWWTQVLGMGRNSYEQRLPDLIWDRPPEDKWALLSGLLEGDGSWSLVNGGPSVILELGTVSAELADGVQRLLGELGIVASQRIGRTAKSTKDTYWLAVSGCRSRSSGRWRSCRSATAPASMPRSPRPASGSRRPATAASMTMARRGFASSARHVAPFRGPVYSLEVPGDAYVCYDKWRNDPSTVSRKM